MQHIHSRIVCSPSVPRRRNPFFGNRFVHSYARRRRRHHHHRHVKRMGSGEKRKSRCWKRRIGTKVEQIAAVKSDMAFRKGWRQQQLQQWPRRITNMRPNSLPFPKQLLLPAYQGGTTVCNTKSRSTSPVWSCRSELELSLDNGRSVQLLLH